MLLFDDSKKLEKALGEEAAAVLAHVLERANEEGKRELATRSDLLMTKTELQKEIADVRIEMQVMKNDLIKWMVGGFITQTAFLVAVLAFLK